MEDEYSKHKWHAAASIDTSNDDVKTDDQMSLDDLNGREIVTIIESIDPNTITPIEALNILFSLKQKLN